MLRLLTPKIHFRFHELFVDGLPVAVLEVGRAFRHPVRFQNEEFIRIGEVKKGDNQMPSTPRLLTYSRCAVMPLRSPMPSPLLSAKLRG